MVKLESRALGELEGNSGFQELMSNYDFENMGETRAFHLKSCLGRMHYAKESDALAFVTAIRAGADIEKLSFLLDKISFQIPSKVVLNSSIKYLKESPLYKDEKACIEEVFKRVTKSEYTINSILTLSW